MATTETTIIVYTIYCITNTKNGKRYVGQTRYDPNKRWKKHVWNASRGLNTRFCEAIRKYGEDAFVVSVLTSNVSSPEDANRFEKMWIIELDTMNHEFGYNSTSGGDQHRHSAGWKMDPIIAERVRLSKIGKPLTARRVKTDEKHRPIVEAFKAGKSREQIAEEFSLKRMRVVKILLRWKAFHEPDLPVGGDHQYNSSGESLQRLADRKIRPIVDDLLTGMTYKDVAEKHGVGYGNVKTIVNRARARWKEFQIPEDHPILTKRKNQHDREGL